MLKDISIKKRILREFQENLEHMKVMASIYDNLSDENKIICEDILRMSSKQSLLFREDLKALENGTYKKRWIDEFLENKLL